MNSKLWGYVATLIIGILSGVGGFQVLVAGDVRELKTQTAHLKEAFDNERLHTDARVFEVVGLVKEVITSNRELTQQLRIQSEQLRIQSELLKQNGGSR